MALFGEEVSAIDAPVVTFFVPGLHAGGAEQVILTLAGELQASGVQCDIVSAQSAGVWIGRVPPGVNLHFLDASKPLLAVLKLRRYLRDRKPQALLSSITSANIAAILAVLLSGTRVRCVVREANFAAHDLTKSSIVSRFLTVTAVRVLYPFADKVVALTEGMKQHVITFLGVRADRIEVIPNPAPRLGTTPGGMPQPYPHRRVIVTCGRLSYQKDHATLLRAFSAVTKVRDLELRIIGEGPLKDELTSLVQDLQIGSRVSFEGYVEEACELIGNSSLFVLSSRWEGFPNVLFEALSQSVPVVSTACSDAVHEILGDGRFGRVVPMENPAALSEAILDIIDNPPTLAGLEAHLDAYAASSIAERYKNVLLPG